MENYEMEIDVDKLKIEGYDINFNINSEFILRLRYLNELVFFLDGDYDNDDLKYMKNIFNQIKNGLKKNIKKITIQL